MFSAEDPNINEFDSQNLDTDLVWVAVEELKLP